MRLETIFFNFPKKILFYFFFLKMDNIFMEKKKRVEKEKNAAARLASILATRWTGNRFVFMDSNVVMIRENVSVRF